MKGRKSAVSPDQVIEAIINFKDRVVTEVDGIKS